MLEYFLSFAAHVSKSQWSMFGWLGVAIFGALRVWALVKAANRYPKHGIMQRSMTYMPWQMARERDFRLYKGIMAWLIVVCIGVLCVLIWITRL
jgi:hypothetical protein